MAFHHVFYLTLFFVVVERVGEGWSQATRLYASFFEAVGEGQSQAPVLSQTPLFSLSLFSIPLFSLSGFGWYDLVALLLLPLSLGLAALVFSALLQPAWRALWYLDSLHKLSGLDCCDEYLWHDDLGFNLRKWRHPSPSSSPPLPSPPPRPRSLARRSRQPSLSPEDLAWKRHYQTLEDTRVAAATTASFHCPPSCTCRASPVFGTFLPTLRLLPLCFSDEAYESAGFPSPASVASGAFGGFSLGPASFAPALAPAPFAPFAPAAATTPEAAPVDYYDDPMDIDEPSPVAAATFSAAAFAPGPGPGPGPDLATTTTNTAAATFPAAASAPSPGPATTTTTTTTAAAAAPAAVSAPGPDPAATTTTTTTTTTVTTTAAAAVPAAAIPGFQFGSGDAPQGMFSFSAATSAPGPGPATTTTTTAPVTPVAPAATISAFQFGSGDTPQGMFSFSAGGKPRPAPDPQQALTSSLADEFDLELSLGNISLDDLDADLDAFDPSAPLEWDDPALAAVDWAAFDLAASLNAELGNF
ncbi:hypothetical protein MBLNU459_g5875t1 [Dothideomycetes sp. NU459]